MPCAHWNSERGAISLILPENPWSSWHRLSTTAASTLGGVGAETGNGDWAASDFTRNTLILPQE